MRRRPGRPSTFDARRARRIARAVLSGSSRRAAARAAGVAESTVRGWERARGGASMGLRPLHGVPPGAALDARKAARDRAALARLKELGQEAGREAAAALSRARARILERERAAQERRPACCGARTRAGAPCRRRPAKGRRRCKLHGGATPQGPDSPHWRHGRRSRPLCKPCYLAGAYSTPTT